MHEFACKHRQAGVCTHTKTHICSLARTYTNIYEVISRSGTLLHVQTHTHTHTNAEQGGQMESQRGLLAFHTLEIWFLTVSSPSAGLFPSRSTSHLPPFLLRSLIIVNASSPWFHLFCPFYLTFFICSLIAGLFTLQTIHDKRSIVLTRLFNSQWGRLFSEDSLWLQRCSGRSGVIILWFWKKKITQLSWAITRKCTFTLAAVFLNQIRGKRKEGEMLSPSTLWVVCAVNIDYRLKAIRIMELKPCSLCQSVLGFTVQFIE